MTPKHHQRTHEYRLRRIPRGPTNHWACTSFHIFDRRTRALVGRLDCWANMHMGHRAHATIRNERHALSITKRADVAVERLLDAIRKR